MKVLVVGSGGREHALVWKISQSKKVEKIFCAPGNGGIAKEAECINISAESVDELVEFSKNEKIDLVVVGPELPLSLGIVDKMKAEGIKVFGPSQKAARLESSKLFSKEFMKRHNIPTAKFESFDDPSEARKYVHSISLPCVIKADGLAAGKGVLICNNKKEAEEAIEKTMEKKEFGEAGRKILIEEFLEGEEASFLIFSDGKNFLAMPSSQDHKRVFDNDQGLNTGGMGAYSPAPIVTDDVKKLIIDNIIEPTISGMSSEGTPYKGILYAGLMIKNGKPFVLEFNVRFGDPEAQPILMRLDSDIIDIFNECIEGDVSKITPKWNSNAAVCVVLASGGYPQSYEKGKIITGLEKLENRKDVKVFHAGTKYDGKNYVTSGGRVLGVTALGNSIPEAIDNAYSAVSLISFEKMHFRKDIGKKALSK
ncbi:MAG: phosphoribosylamine--glycine ligase [Candidatus Schekmanbacteria bacterium]|nr:MAG: phosphoribosylamine--glycine ligase [Candidatus Schekmanbacteria bacterium]